MCTLVIPSQLSISRVQKVFDNDGKLLDENHKKRILRLLDEFEWYVSAFTKQKENGTPC